MHTLRIVVVGAIVTLLGTPSPPAIGDVVGGSGCWEPRRAEQGFARLINSERAARGEGHLHLDPELSKTARVHTREMVRTDTLHHTPTRTLTSRVTNWVVLGENVGVGQSVSTLHDAFMDSAAHRANVLNQSYRHVGVGVLRHDGRLWVTIIFEGVSNPGTALPMPSC